MVPVVRPVRVTVNVNAVCPRIPFRLGGVGGGDGQRRVVVADVPTADAVVIWAPPAALDSVTEKPSSGSTAVSPLTLTVIVWLVSPAAKLTWPLGSVPPKSAALAGFVPLPVTA